MIKTENQHWLPKFLIKNFADSDGKVFRLNIADGKVTKLPPKRAAARANFNVLLVNGLPKSFESAFQRLETAAAPGIAKVLETEGLNQISQCQRIAIARFIAAQTIRTEAYRLGLQTHRSRYDLGEVLNLQMDNLDSLTKLVECRKWALLVAAEDLRFYLGDHPVVLQNTEQPGQAGKLGLDMVGVEVFIPLAPRFALYMPCNTTSDEIISGYCDALRIVTADLAGIELIDFQLEEAMSAARRALDAAGPLYRALEYGEPFSADKGNLENLNYLQCAWSSSGIYSCGSDFSFALRVFSENPEYKNYASLIPTQAGIHQLTNSLKSGGA